jgi:hypothetical protein
MWPVNDEPAPRPADQSPMQCDPPGDEAETADAPVAAADDRTPEEAGYGYGV